MFSGALTHPPKGEEGAVKGFWDDLFYDMDECGLSREDFAMKAGNEIRADLRQIEDAIRGYDGKAALALIAKMKEDL